MLPTPSLNTIADVAGLGTSYSPGNNDYGLQAVEALEHGLEARFKIKRHW